MNGVKYAVGTFLALVALYGSFALCFWYGGQCVFETSACSPSISTMKYTAGTIIRILYSLFLPALSLNQLTPSLEKILDGKEAAARIFAVIDRTPLIVSQPNAVKPAVNGKI
jgi:ATP-binding cassette, subfamily B (MDR/TAP), member 1